MSETEKPAADKADASDKDEETSKKPKEIGGAKGPDPTRYGDWQHKGIVSDF